MRNWAIAILISLLLAGCKPKTLYTPEAQIRPAEPTFGVTFGVRLYGATVARYRFLGARREPDGSWTVKLDPVSLLPVARAGEFTVRPGDVVPLSPEPTVLVQFVEIEPTKLVLQTVGVRKAPHQPH